MEGLGIAGTRAPCVKGTHEDTEQFGKAHRCFLQSLFRKRHRMFEKFEQVLRVPTIAPFDRSLTQLWFRGDVLHSDQDGYRVRLMVRGVRECALKPDAVALVLSEATD